MHKTIHNVITGEILEVPLTAKEIADLENRQEIVAEIKAKNDAEAKANATAKAAILDRIGLTADELKTILG